MRVEVCDRIVHALSKPLYDGRSGGRIQNVKRRSTWCWARAPDSKIRTAIAVIVSLGRGVGSGGPEAGLPVDAAGARSEVPGADSTAASNDSEIGLAITIVVAGHYGIAG